MNYFLDSILLWQATRKPRTDFTLDKLPDEDKATCLEYVARFGPAKARELIKKDFAVVMPQSSLSTWHSQLRPFILVARRRAAVSGANTLGQEAIRDQADIDTANLAALKSTLFEILSSDAPTEAQLRMALSGVLKLRDQTSNDRRIAVLEKQATEAKETVHNSKLSDAEKAKRFREIFKK